MRFLVTKELGTSAFLHYLLGILTLFALLFLVTDIALHHYQVGLTLDKAVATLHGNDVTFEEPILFDVLLLQVHIDLFMSMFILLILAAMFIRLYEKSKHTKIWIHLLFITGIISPLLLLLNYFLSNSMGIALWIAFFMLWHMIAFYFCIKILWKLYVQ